MMSAIFWKEKVFGNVESCECNDGNSKTWKSALESVNSGHRTFESPSFSVVYKIMLVLFTNTLEIDKTYLLAQGSLSAIFK